MTDLISLIHKRHEGDAWQVFTELANGTGYHVKGWADAAALGLWPSRGYELHGYECKISREDLKKELRDPSKADTIGKYCHFWWLVVSDEKITDGLVIPDTWGILAPKSARADTILKVVRKAPKLTPTPFDVRFVVAMIRNVTKTWVPKREHDELKANVQAEVKKELELELQRKRTDAEYELSGLKSKVAAFTEITGISLDTEADWAIRDLAHAAKAVAERRRRIGYSRIDEEPAALIREEISRLRFSIDNHEQAIARRRGLMFHLETELNEATKAGEDHAYPVNTPNVIKTP